MAAMNPSQIRAAQRTMSRLTRILAGDFSVRVEFRMGVPHTDGKVVVLNPAYDADPVRNRIAAEAVAAHEAAGHIRYTDFTAWLTMIDDVISGVEDPIMRDMVNLVEDARVNALLRKQFPGSGEMMDVHHALTHAKFVEAIKQGQQQHLAPGLIALASELIAGQPNPYEGMDGDLAETVNAFMAKVRKMANYKQASTQAAIDHAREIAKVYREFFPASDEQMQDEANARQDGENPFADDDHSDEQVSKNASQQRAQQRKAQEVGEEDFEEGSSMPGQPSDEEPGEEEGDGDGDGDGEEGDEEGEGGSSSDGEEEDGDESDAESDGEKHKDDASNYDGDTISGAGSDDDDESDSPVEWEGEEGEEGENNAEGGNGHKSVDPALLERIKEAVEEAMEQEQQEQAQVEKQEMGAVGDADHYRDSNQYGAGHNATVVGTAKNGVSDAGRYDAYAAIHKRQSNTLYQQMRRLIEARKPGKVSRRNRMGILDERRLVWGDDSDRIYKRKQSPKSAKVAVEIVIDASGSMGGQRARSAAEAAVVMCEMLEKLGWDYEVVDFMGHGSNAKIFVRKGFGDALNGMTKNAISAARADECTPAGAAAMWARARLEKMDAKRLCIMIFDGEPDDSQVLHEAVKDSKDIAWLGVGIDGCDVSAWFENAISCGADELASVGMSTIKKFAKEA